MELKTNFHEARVASALELAAKSLSDAVMHRLQEETFSQPSAASDQNTANEQHHTEQRKDGTTTNSANNDQRGDDDDDLAAAFFRQRAQKQAQGNRLPIDEWALLFLQAQKRKNINKLLEQKEKEKEFDKKKKREDLINDIVLKLEWR